MVLNRLVRLSELALVFLLLHSTFFVSVYAQDNQSVYFSEIAWAGSSVSSADEWVELANAGSIDIDLTGWQITRWNHTTKQEALMVSLVGVIPSHGFFVVGNNSAKHVFSNGQSTLSVDPHYSNSAVSLSNDSFQLKLYDGDFTDGRPPIDRAGDTQSPLAGSSTPKSSMVRKVPIEDGELSGSWYSASLSRGFDDGTPDLGTPGLPNISKPFATIECDTTKVPRNQPISLSCSGYAFDYNGEDLSMNLTWGLQNEYIQVYNGRWQWRADILPSDNFSVHATATNISGFATDVIFTPSLFSLSDMIVISEVMPDPSSGEEWIELHNQGDVDIDVIDWELDDLRGSGSKSYVFPHTVIRAGEFITLTKSVTGIGLNNDGDEVNLIDPLSTVIDTTTYSDAPDNQSWVRLNERSFAWSGSQTPLRENELPERTNYFGLVQINEVVPNPVGLDEQGEWVELLSTSLEPIDLSGWVLDDEDDGSSPYTFPAGSHLQPGKYLVITRVTSEIAFNNYVDSVRLFAPDGSCIETVTYSGAVEGESYAYIEREWRWTDSLTPGDANKPHKQEVVQSIGIDQPITSSPSLTAEFVNTTSDTLAVSVELTESTPSLHMSTTEIPLAVSKSDIREQTHADTGVVTSERGLIKGAQSRHTRSVPLLIILFSGILISVIMGMIPIWNTQRYSQKKSSKPTPETTHPG